MKWFFLPVIFTLAVSLKSCSQKLIPASYSNGYKSFAQFFERQFDVEKLRQELVENSKKPQRVLVSFIIRKDGIVDSLVVNEKTSDKLALEVTRVIRLSSRKWTPSKMNGIAKNSPRIFLPVFISCIDCSKGGDQNSSKANEDYFRDYKYPGLQEWSDNSIVHKAIGFVIFPTVR